VKTFNGPANSNARWASTLLVVFLSWAFALAISLGLNLGCAGASALAKDFDEINNPADDATLRKCRQEMRTSLDGGKPETEAAKKAAFKTYYDCTVDGGLR
jgi:hypothetical protein